MIVRSSPTPTFAAVATAKRPLTRLRFLFAPPLANSRAGFSSSSPQLRRGLECTARDAVPFRKEQGRERDDGGAERPVHCEVDVISWRERKIRARVAVDASVEEVWGVLTDYDRLADFVPNLVYSGTVPCPHPGRIWLEQRGLQRALYWQIEARVVLDLHEVPNSGNGHELRFSMVDGDFKKFEGKWSVIPVARSSTATLTYEVSVIPRFNFPAMFIERIIRSDLPVNLRALANRAEKHSQGNRKIHGSRNSTNPATKVSFSFSSVDLCGSIHGNEESPNKDIIENSESVGAAPTSPSSTELSNWGVFGKFCSLDKPCMVDEVHLRRFDGLLENGGVHRCVVASITVKAPTREVWNVLTAYEKLPEFVPNLAISKVLLRDNNRVRIVQEGCKGLLYMVLHARVILDLHEHVEKEITFEQVEGDFDLFHGKWLLEQLGNDHTLLKYIIESKIHKDVFLSEAIVEEVIYEDLPSNLCAIRDYIEKGEAVTLKSSMHAGSFSCPVIPTKDEVNFSRVSTPKIISGSKSSIPVVQRAKVPGLQRDFKVLEAELLSFISKYGQEGFMPMRKQLRIHGRVDIEKAIARMGGFRKIADSMNLCLAYKDRKPKGYWDNLENLQKEIGQFQSYWGMDPMYMPSRKTFERAGRYDIARALEKWGGLHEVSRLLHLELRHPRRQSVSDHEKNNDFKRPNDLNGREKTIYKPYVTQDTQKWLMKLTDLDINWLE